MKWRAALCVCACLGGGVAARPVLDASHDWHGAVDDAYTSQPTEAPTSTTTTAPSTTTTSVPEASTSTTASTIGATTSTSSAATSTAGSTAPSASSTTEPTTEPTSTVAPCPPCPQFAYAVLASSTVTNTGPTTVAGGVGLWPGTAVTGFPPGEGFVDAGTSTAGAAQVELTTAYLAAFLLPSTTVNAQLGGLTLTPGVYSGPSKMPLAITGTLTLDGPGEYVFQTDSTLVTGSGSRVQLVNGARACDITWQVGSSATLGTGSVFAGNILALASITVTTGVTIEGRVLARTAAVTLDSDTITASTGC